MNIRIAGMAVSKLILQVFITGLWGTANAFTQDQYKDSSRHVIGELKRGAEDQVFKLKRINK